MARVLLISFLVLTACGARQSKDPCRVHMNDRKAGRDPNAGLDQTTRTSNLWPASGACTSSCYQGWQGDGYTTAEGCYELGLVMFEMNDPEDAGRAMISGCMAGSAPSCAWLKAHPDAEALAIAFNTKETPYYAPGTYDDSGSSGGGSSTSDSLIETAITGLTQVASDDGYQLLDRTTSTTTAVYKFVSGVTYYVVLLAEEGPLIQDAVVFEHVYEGTRVRQVASFGATKTDDGLVFSTAKFTASEDIQGGVQFSSGNMSVVILIFGK